MADMKIVLAGGVALLLIAIFVMGVSLSATGAFDSFAKYRERDKVSAALVAANQPTLNTPFEVLGTFNKDMNAYTPDPSREYISYTGSTMRDGVRDVSTGNIMYIKEYACGGFCAKKTGQIVKCEIQQNGETIACGCPGGFEHSGCKFIPVTSPGQ